MKTQNHISENDLRQVVMEQQTKLSQQQIETHVSECEFCQTRLMEIAADDTWREEFSSSLHELPSIQNSQIDTGEFSLRLQKPVGDEFDLVTVEQMLKEVLEPPRHPEMLGRLDRYDVESILGCGGMGVVLRGFDRDLHRPVAIKMILPRLSRNGTAKQRFEREARAAAAVLHPNVIAIHGISKTADVPWFAMPLVAGPSLGKLVSSLGPLPEKEIVRIGMQIASGLAAAHSQGLVHRDIKPENILVDNQVNRVVITDFGLARRDSEESMTQTGLLAGTLNYMSPEQSRGEDVDARSDLFSLGSLLFYLAAGVVPFKADSAMRVLHKVGNDSHPNVQNLNPEVSKTLTELIDRLLEKDPINRFQTAVEVETFLEEYLAHLNHPTKADAPKLPQQQALKWSGKWIAGALSISAIMVAAIWWSQLGTDFSKKSSPDATAPTEIESLSELEATWESIAAKHQLDDEPTFNQGIQRLGDSINRFNQEIHAEAFGYPSQFDDDILELSLEIEQLTNQLNWPESEIQGDHH